MALTSVPATLIHPELLQRLRRAFPPRAVVPSTAPTAVYYEAGQQSVMAMLERELTSTTTSGDPKDLKGA